MNDKVKAYSVQDEDWDRGAVVFHKHAIAARHIGAQEVDSEFEYVTCRRAPEFDQYAEQGFVYPKDLLRNGWHWECCNCGLMLEEECYDEEDKLISLDDMVEDGRHRIFCGDECYSSWTYERVAKDEFFEQFKETIKQARPDLEFRDHLGGWPYITMSAKFDFEGSQFGGGTVRVEYPSMKLSWWIANGDKAAWGKYKEKNDGSI